MAIQWRDNLYYLDSVKLPNDENTYWIKDTEAREAIETLSNATHFLGVTTTALTDGATTNPITIDNKSVNAQNGDIVIYNAGTELAPKNKEFIFNGTTWQEFGDPSINNLGSLAYQNSASGSYTPEGSVNLTSTSMSVVTGVTHSFGINANFSGDQEPDYNVAWLDVDVELISGAISYFGSSQALNYINLPSQNNAGFSYSNIVTAMSDHTTNVVQSIALGNLPTISNTSTITATMGTGSSSTTLIFSLSDIGFNPGTQPNVTYSNVVSGVTYTDVSVDFLTLSPNTVDIVVGASGETSLYYSIGLTGDIEATTSSALSGVTATFAGSASTITVS